MDGEIVNTPVAEPTVVPATWTPPTEATWKPVSANAEKAKALALEIGALYKTITSDHDNARSVRSLLGAVQSKLEHAAEVLKALEGE